MALGGSAALVLTRGLNEIFRPVALYASARPVRWVFLVDTYKCIGCGFCVKACKLENEIPFDANVSRTWVERYVVTKEGEVFADTPKEARNGFTTSRIDLGQGRYQDIPGRKLTRPFLCPSSATSAKNRPVSRYVRWALPIKPRREWSSWTESGASGAAIASWPAPTE